MLTKTKIFNRDLLYHDEARVIKNAQSLSKNYNTYA